MEEKIKNTQKRKNIINNKPIRNIPLKNKRTEKFIKTRNKCK